MFPLALDALILHVFFKDTWEWGGNVLSCTHKKKKPNVNIYLRQLQIHATGQEVKHNHQQKC